jgi:hypothetical protein
MKRLKIIVPTDADMNDPYGLIVVKLSSFEYYRNKNFGTVDPSELSKYQSVAISGGSLLDEAALISLSRMNLNIFKETLEYNPKLYLYDKLSSFECDNYFFDTNKTFNRYSFYISYYKHLKTINDYNGLASLINKTVHYADQAGMFEGEIGIKRFYNILKDYAKSGYPLTPELYDFYLGWYVNENASITSDQIIKMNLINFKKLYENTNDLEKLMLNKIIKNNKEIFSKKVETNSPDHN